MQYQNNTSKMKSVVLSKNFAKEVRLKFSLQNISRMKQTNVWMKGIEDVYDPSPFCSETSKRQHAVICSERLLRTGKSFTF